MTPLKSLFAASSLLLLAFARSHDGSGEGRVDTTKFPLIVTSYTLIFDSTGRKVLAERNNKTGKWKVYDMQKTLDVLYKGAKRPCPELIVEPEQENNFQLQLNESGRRSFVSALATIPDSLPVVKVKKIFTARDLCRSTIYMDSNGKYYFHYCHDNKIYNKYPNDDGAAELRVRLDTSKTILERLNGMQPFPSPLPDSLPKYRYVVRLEIPAGQYSTSIDTLYMIMGELGKTLTVDQAAQYRNLADRQLYRIAQYGRIDSVKIETKGGVK
jgi:hypothetical protein